jgi:hypothetical protein
MQMKLNDSGRYELKYVVNRDQYGSLVEALAGTMQPDPYGDTVGRYRVASLYYDTPDYKAYWDKSNGLRFRRKVRIRAYGSQVITPDAACFVEIKQRTNRIIHKKRVTLPYSLATDLCERGKGANGIPGTDRAVMDEVVYLRNVQHLRPACIISYDRQAWIGTERDPGLRVTFDTNMKCRAHDLSLLSQGFTQDRLLMSPEECVMEIKAEGQVPYWLTRFIGEQGCTLRAVSKYCLALEKCVGTLQRQRITSYQPVFGLG